MSGDSGSDAQQLSSGVVGALVLVALANSIIIVYATLLITRVVQIKTLVDELVPGA